MAKKYYNSKEGGEGKWGEGQFANMPKEEVMKEYPKMPYIGGQYNDTIDGIDAVNSGSVGKVNKMPSRQK